MPVAAIRFARMGSFSEAFNFSATLPTIRQIGWINYIIALILITIVIGIPFFIIIFAFIVLLVLMPLFGVFQARYITKVYDSAITTA